MYLANSPFLLTYNTPSFRARNPHALLLPLPTAHQSRPTQPHEIRFISTLPFVQTLTEPIGGGRWVLERRHEFREGKGRIERVETTW
jgi:hypothetical protein